MYCIKCGRKNLDNESFCINCGTKIEKYAHDYSKLINIVKKVFIIFIIFFTLYNIYYFCFSEEAYIKKWVTAYALNDYETVIKLSNIKKNEFMSSKEIERKYGKVKYAPVDVKILSDNHGKKHNRTVSYTINGKTALLNIIVIKDFFNYKIEVNDALASSVKFKLSKGDELYIDGVMLKDKYLDKQEKKYNVYKIDDLLRKNVSIKVKLANGTYLSTVKTLFDNEEVNLFNLKYTEIDEDNLNKANSISKYVISEIINGIENNKELSDINNTKFSEEMLKSDLMMNIYNNLKEKNYGKYSKFVVSDLKIVNIKLLENDKIDVKYRMTYEYEDAIKNKHKRLRNYSITFNNNYEVSNIDLNNLMKMF